MVFPSEPIIWKENEFKLYSLSRSTYFLVFSTKFKKKNPATIYKKQNQKAILIHI